MNIKGLRAFNNIMANGTLSAAAQVMNISESALSRQLALLESEIGLTLFSREKRHLTPTPQGEAFYREAERLLESIEQIPEIVKDIKANPGRRMSIIAMPRMATAVVAPAVIRLAKEFPDIQISVDIQPRRFLERWVARHEFELGLGALPSRHAAINTEWLCSVPAVAVVAPGHHLADRQSVTVQDLATERFVSVYPNTLIYQKIEQIFDHADVPFVASMHVSLTYMACALAATGEAVTICDAMAPAILGSAVRMIPIEPRFGFEFGILYRRNAERTLEAIRLVEIVREEAANYLDRLPFK